MMTEAGSRSRSHGISIDVLTEQSAALGIPLVTRSASWKDYEESFVGALAELKSLGIGVGIFGDIDLEDHRKWVNRVCESRGIVPLLPLWGEEHAGLVDEFLRLGFRAKIISVKEGALDKEVLGRDLTRHLIAELAERGIDPSGEAGEFHTVVADGPLFSRPVKLIEREAVLRDGYWFLDVACQPGQQSKRE